MCHLKYLYFFLIVHLHVMLKGMKLVKWNLACSISCFSFPSLISEAMVKEWGCTHPQPQKEISSLGWKGQSPDLYWFILRYRCSVCFPWVLPLEDRAQHWFHKNLSDLLCGLIHMLSGPAESLSEACKVPLAMCSSSWNKLQMQSSVRSVCRDHLLQVPCSPWDGLWDCGLSGVGVRNMFLQMSAKHHAEL